MVETNYRDMAECPFKVGDLLFVPQNHPEMRRQRVIEIVTPSTQTKNYLIGRQKWGMLTRPDQFPDFGLALHTNTNIDSDVRVLAEVK